MIRGVVVAVVALALAGEALACSCLPVDLVRDLPKADGAFVGTLLERTVSGDGATLRFRVEQVYKGEIENRIEVRTARDGAACGVELPVGERTGLLLDRDGGVWRSSLCSQVDAAEFLELSDVEDNALPPVNWGGILVGVLILGAGAFLLVRRLRRYRRFE